MTTRCPWCNEEVNLVHGGQHASWCPHRMAPLKPGLDYMSTEAKLAAYKKDVLARVAAMRPQSLESMVADVAKMMKIPCRVASGGPKFVSHIIGITNMDVIQEMERYRTVGWDWCYYATEEDYVAGRRIDVSAIRASLWNL